MGANLIAALIKARGEFAPAVKNKINPHFKSRYVDLAEVIDATDDALRKNGLAVIQPTDVDAQGRCVLVTKLIHISGEIEEGRYLLSPAKPDPQGYGAAMTYARRYCYMAILGIAAEDDDGNAASRPSGLRRPAPEHHPLTTSNGSQKPGMPETGQELLDRLTAKEKKLVAEGACRVGALLEAVMDAGVEAGITAHISEWSREGIELAVRAAKSFERAISRK